MHCGHGQKPSGARAAAQWARQKEDGLPGGSLQLAKLAHFALAQWTEALGMDGTPLWRSLLSRVEAARAAYEASQNPNDIASVFAYALVMFPLAPHVDEWCARARRSKVWGTRKAGHAVDEDIKSG